MLSPEVNLRRQIKQAIQGLPLYNGGPGADYTHAPVAFAVNVTLVHLPGFDPFKLPYDLPLDSRALIVQRASGHGQVGSWSGVSGYIDVGCDPAGQLNSRAGQNGGEDFDPIRYTIRQELMEECGLTPEVIDRILFYPGEHFCVTSHNGGSLWVVPVLGIYTAGLLPAVVTNPLEVSGHSWTPLSHLPNVEDIETGYIQNTLPRVLRALCR